MIDTPPRHPIPVVRLIIPDPQERVLILKRPEGVAGAGQWTLPGGKIDRDQTIEDALRTELQEETALRLQSHRFLFWSDGVPPDPGRPQYLSLYFLCQATGDIALNAESAAFAWMPREDYDRYDFAFAHGDALLRFWEFSER